MKLGHIFQLIYQVPEESCFGFQPWMKRHKEIVRNFWKWQTTKLCKKYLSKEQIYMCTCWLDSYK